MSEIINVLGETELAAAVVNFNLFKKIYGCLSLAVKQGDA